MKKLTALAALVAAGIAALAGVQIGGAGSAQASPEGCQLGNGVQHVINIVFDNVHFSRDNPNVPSDLEQMPHLLNFLKQYGTVFSNSHTPMIAHTADDSLSIYTGLYGDRHGQPLSNSYKVYNPDGSTDPATSFTYWTSPIIDTKTTPPFVNPVDSSPSMAYAGGGVTPAPWVPFTRAGCSVGDFSTANMVLENATVDVPTVFGADSPEAHQTANDPNKFKDAEVAQYLGEAIHCAQGASICADSSRPLDDLLPSEPGGYQGYQGVFGAKYMAPGIAKAIDPTSPDGANVFHDGFRVTDASGNLVDLNGNTLTEAFGGGPGFTGFSPTATQSLAVLADMQEAGIPVTYGYISDLHEKKTDTATGCTTTGTPPLSGKPVGPGDSCYVANAQH